MDRDEAIAKGVKVNDTRHSMKRRCPWHDYHGKGTYMLTLVVEGRMPLLGRLAGQVDARPGDGDAPKVMLSELGAAIAKEEIPKIHKYKPCGESFDACSEGLLLQISPWDYHMEKKTITREQCLELNEMAERIAEGR